MSDTSDIPGFSVADREKLAELHGEGDQPITTVDQLWARVGSDFDKGISKLAAQKQLDAQQLTQLLTAQALREANASGGSWLQRHWLDSLLFGFALVLLGLLLRGIGVFGGLPPPLGLPGNVLVAARDLVPGQALRAEDFYQKPFPAASDYFTATDQLAGTVISQTVRRGQALRFDAVTRLQVVAANDILTDTIISRQDLVLRWTPYQPTAAVRTEQVLGQQARYAIPKDAVILSNVLDSASRRQQVVLAVASGLPPLHIISASDLVLSDTTRLDDAFTSIDEVVGRVTLQAVAPGATLRRNQLSAVQFDAQVLAGRFLLAVPLRASALPPTVAPGSRVILLLTSDSTPSETVPPIDDAIVVDIAQNGETATLSVAVPGAALQETWPWLGHTQVFVVQELTP